MTLTSGTGIHMYSCTHISQLFVHIFCSYSSIVSIKSDTEAFSQRKRIKNQCLPCSKVGQGQSRIII